MILSRGDLYPLLHILYDMLYRYVAVVIFTVYAKLSNTFFLFFPTGMPHHISQQPTVQ